MYTLYNGTVLVLANFIFTIDLFYNRRLKGGGNNQNII